MLVDEALPPEELDAVRDAIAEFAPRGVCGYHKLRARRAGSRRYVDLHVQFVAGTTLEDAHATAHRLQDAIRERLRGADVLIHLEPEASVHPGRSCARTEGDRCVLTPCTGVKTPVIGAVGLLSPQA